MNENIFEIAELLNEVMQKRADNSNVRYFCEDGDWYYQDEDGDIYESKESAILFEAQEQWETFLEEMVSKAQARGIQSHVTGANAEEMAYGALIDGYTDHEETVMERFLLDEMTTEQRAAAYKAYLESEICDELQRLQVILNY